MRTILFQGDSITDCGRSREGTPEVMRPADYGFGYPNLVSGTLLAANPGEYQCIDRGVSGNRVVDLYARWKMDALNLKPDMISILIGVNDVWHEFSRGNGVETARYAQIYRMLLAWTKEVLPEVKLMIMEPFMLISEVGGEDFLADVKDHARAAREVAEEFDAVFVPLQDKFDAAAKLAPNSYWLFDGVHPTPAGHRIIADEWLKAAEPLLKW
jgi:lysophospholipase L1-like esterase